MTNSRLHPIFKEIFEPRPGDQALLEICPYCHSRKYHCDCDICKNCDCIADDCECECKDSPDGNHEWGEFEPYLPATRHAPAEGGYRECVHCGDTDDNYDRFDHQADQELDRARFLESY